MSNYKAIVFVLLFTILNNLKTVNNSIYFYNKVSPVYNLCLDWVFNPGRQRIADELNSKIDLDILEIGSGTGSFVEFLNAKNNYIGIEGAKRMFDISKLKYPNYNFVHTKYEDYKPTKKFDVIVLLYTLSVVDDSFDLMNSINDWLEPGGKVYVVNHFSKNNLIYKILQKISVHSGYNAYFPFKPNLFSRYFKIVIFESVNLFGGWSYLELMKKKHE